ncbi:MAG: hypothetical protein IJ859_00265 [Synergistaceae bacterium]|nr:hypothetical protein [Synergistaceae bacterium]
MKKIFLTLCLVLSLCSYSYGAASDDIYVRKDVFEVEMRNVNLKLDNVLAKLNQQGEEIKALAQSVAVLSERVDGNYKNLDARMNDLRNGLYLGLVLFAAVLLLTFFNKWWEVLDEKRQAAVPTFTLDDVKRLIAEAKLGTTFSA